MQRFIVQIFDIFTAELSDNGLFRSRLLCEVPTFTCACTVGESVREDVTHNLPAERKGRDGIVEESKIETARLIFVITTITQTNNFF